MQPVLVRSEKLDLQLTRSFAGQYDCKRKDRWDQRLRRGAGKTFGRNRRPGRQSASRRQAQLESANSYPL